MLRTRGRPHILARPAALALTLLFMSTLAAPFANAAVTIIFVSPTPSQTVMGSVDLEVKMDTNPISVGLYIDGMYFTDMTYSGYDFTHWHFKYNLDTWGLNDGSHMVRVEVREISGDTSKGMTFYVDNYSPIITDLDVMYPYGQEAAKKGDRLTITARVSDGVSGIDHVYCDATKLQSQNSIGMYDDGQHNDSVEGDGIFGTDPFTVGALTNGYNIAYIWAADKMGNDAMMSIPVAMDNTPPRVVEKIVEYPVGQQAAKLGDHIRIVSTVEDKGEGGYLRVGTDIVLVLDNSGSMRHGMDPAMNYLKEAVNKFVNVSHPQDRIAIYAFTDNGKNLWEDTHLYMDFTPMDDDGKQAVRDFLANDWEFNRAHNTPIWDTIGDAVQYAIQDSIHQPVVVAITDGTDYGYDWYERPDPTWWEDAYNWGYTGLGFERGSERYAPWNNWGSTVKYTTHYGEYPAPWPDDPEVHSFEVPIADTNTFNYSGIPGGDEDRDYSSGLRKGLLNAPLPVFTIGLGLPHHSPIMKNTTEYDLYRIATTSSNESIRGKYYHAPESNDLDQIYEEISFFINLAGDINITPPGGLRRFTLDATVIGQEILKVLHDDGDHNDIYEDDETFGTEMFDVKSDATRVVNVTLEAEDIVGHDVEVQVEVLIDNNQPVIDDLVPHVLDPESLLEISKHYVSDGDMAFFTVNASDWGEVRGLTRVVLDGRPIGGDLELLMVDDGEGYDERKGDGMFTSGAVTVATSGSDGFVQLTATAYDIALNKASTTGDLLVLNTLDITGQIVEPLNGTYVRGFVEIHLRVSDMVNVVGASLFIIPYSPLDKDLDTIELMMTWDSELDAFKTQWNTTAYPDYAYYLNGQIHTKADTLVDTETITIMVDNTPPEVEILSPEDETIIAQVTQIQVHAEDKTIILDGEDLINMVEFTLGDDIYNVLTRKPKGQPGSYNYFATIDPTLMEDGAYVILVRATDMAGWEAFDNITVYIDTVSPIITPIYVPPIDSNISMDFNFAFDAEDTSGIDRALLRFDNGGLEYVIPFNPSTELWEYNLDTTILKDGNHTYCAVFWDKVGLESEYCSVFTVDNSDAPKPPPKKDSNLWEMPWWVLLILIVSIAIMVLAVVLMVRDRYWKQKAEEDLIDRVGKEDMERELEEEKELESAPTVPLPPPLPPGEAAPKSRKERARKKDDLLELSGIAPVLAPKAEAKKVEEKEPVTRPRKKGKKRSKKKGGKKFVRCPMCRNKIKVTSDKRPVVIHCNVCGAKGKLR